MSEVWHCARPIRITASSAKGVPVRATTNPDKFMREHLFPNFQGNAATKHGSENKAIARNLQEKRSAGVPLWFQGQLDRIIHGMELLEKIRTTPPH